MGAAASGMGYGIRTSQSPCGPLPQLAGEGGAKRRMGCGPPLRRKSDCATVIANLRRTIPAFRTPSGLRPPSPLRGEGELVTAMKSPEEHREFDLCECRFRHGGAGPRVYPPGLLSAVLLDRRIARCSRCRCEAVSPLDKGWRLPSSSSRGARSDVATQGAAASGAGSQRVHLKDLAEAARPSPAARSHGDGSGPFRQRSDRRTAPIRLRQTPTAYRDAGATLVRRRPPGTRGEISDATFGPDAT